ncbi:MAG: PIN domain-containing protein [Chitinivibrionia bacterium]|nr:PIN domain-containing protein [Chitinivibrionia bacterium]
MVETKYLLDTNICAFLIRDRFNIKEKIRQIGGLNSCAISEITYAELYYGAESSEYKIKNLDILDVFAKNIKIIPIRKTIPLFAKEKVRLKKKGQIIDDFDLLIGTTAVANNLIMVSENEKHLSRIENIKLENWVQRQ